MINYKEFMKTVVIFGAAPIKNYENVKKYISSDDFFIFCDGGLVHQKKLDIAPDLIIGDFDSFNFSDLPEDLQKSTEIIKLPCEKDDTDVFFAVKEACRRGFESFKFFGVLGNRFDHSVVNISVLLYLKKLGKQAVLVDDFSEICVFDNHPQEISSDFGYFSVLCIDGTLEGVNITDAKYPLKNAVISTDYQYGVSNEVLEDKKNAHVWAEKGFGLLVKVIKDIS